MFFISSKLMKENIRKFKKNVDISFGRNGINFNEIAEVQEEEIIQDPPFFIKKIVKRELSAQIDKTNMFSYEESGMIFSANVRLLKRLLSEKVLSLDVNEAAQELNITANLRKATFSQKINEVVQC